MRRLRVGRILWFSGLSLIALACGAPPNDGPAPTVEAAAVTLAAIVARAVRLIAPLSGSLAGAAQPRFRVSGAEAALVEVCADPACAHPLQAFIAIEGNGRPRRPLSPGVVFWRARALVLGDASGWTPAWELFVPPGGSAVAATRGLRFDADADGFADAAVRDQNDEAATDRLHVYRGSASGLLPASDTVLTLDTSHFGVPAVSAGDVNGDGFGDLAVADGRGLVIYAGSASGISPAPISITPPPAGIPPFLFGVHLVAGGDVDGDGYGDVFADDNDQHVWLYLGSPGGLSATPAWTLDRSNTGRFALLLTAADLNGDGFADLVIQDFGPGGTPQAFRVFRGSPAGLESPAAGTLVVRPNLPSGTAGDVNGDGVPDLVTSEVTQLAFFPGGPTFPPPAPTEVLSTAQRALPLQLADFDGDGLADLAATTSVQSTSMFFTDDRVDVYPGTPAGFAAAPTVTIHETDVLPDDTLNFGRLTSADFDRDGRDDLMVGAQAPFPTPFFDTSTPAVFVFGGSAAGLQPTPAVEITGAPGYASWVSAAAPQFP